MARVAHATRPARTVATETWPPNVDVAGRRLRPLGITVVRTDPAPDNVDQAEDETRGRLPFPDDSFALATSRHTSLVAGEVARVLDFDGAFLTQQVGGAYETSIARSICRPRRHRRGAGTWGSPNNN